MVGIGQQCCCPIQDAIVVGGINRATTRGQNWTATMSHSFLRILSIFILALFCLTAGCENGFKKKTAHGTYVFQKKKFKKMVEDDPFPMADSANRSQ